MVRKRVGAFWRRASLSILVLGFARHNASLWQCFSGYLQRPGTRPASVDEGHGHFSARLAAPWDIFFGGEKLPVPQSSKELTLELQSAMMTAVEQAIPRFDIELPPAMGLGIEGKHALLVAPQDEEIRAAAVARGDRELAAAFVLLFEGLSNDRSLCIAFRNEKLLTKAKRVWQDWGKTRLITLPDPNRATFGGENTVRDRIKRPFLVAVAPSNGQLKELAAMAKAEEESEGKQICLILVNARIRGLNLADETRQFMAVRSNPIFHARFAGTRNEGLVFRKLGDPWVVARRDSASGNFTEVSRSDEEPTAEAINAALAG